MLVLRDPKALFQVDDRRLRALLARRTEDLLAEAGGDHELRDLVTFVVIGPGDSLEAMEAQLGFPVLRNRFDGTRFGDPGFAPSFELIEEHAGYYELVFVLSDDGFGVEVFVPKEPGAPPELLAMCAQYAIPARESPE
jgi:hypothetical protein